MGSSHCINVILLHQNNICFHLHPIDRLTDNRVAFMAVDTPEDDILPVDQDPVALDFNFAESKLDLGGFDFLIFRIPQNQLEGI